MANYPYYQQQPQPMPYYGTQPRPQPYIDQPQPQLGIKGRPVSSIEEARATSIDFDGSVFYFPDLANKKIYTKQINIDGTATLNVYERKNEPMVNSTQYVTREEFESVLQQLKSQLLFVAPPQQQQPQPMAMAPQQEQKEEPKIEF